MTLRPGGSAASRRALFNCKYSEKFWGGNGIAVCLTIFLVVKRLACHASGAPGVVRKFRSGLTYRPPPPTACKPARWRQWLLRAAKRPLLRPETGRTVPRHGPFCPASSPHRAVATAFVNAFEPKLVVRLQPDSVLLPGRLLSAFVARRLKPPPCRCRCRQPGMAAMDARQRAAMRAKTNFFCPLHENFRRKVWRFAKNSLPLHRNSEMKRKQNVGSVAQLNRASDYGSEGYGFESHRSHSRQRAAFARMRPAFLLPPAAASAPPLPAPAFTAATAGRQQSLGRRRRQLPPAQAPMKTTSAAGHCPQRLWFVISSLASSLPSLPPRSRAPRP